MQRGSVRAIMDAWVLWANDAKLRRAGLTPSLLWSFSCVRIRLSRHAQWKLILLTRFATRDKMHHCIHGNPIH